MPTISQMHKIWESEFEFKTNCDRPHNNPLPEFSGEVIGAIVYDPENQDLKIIVNKEKENGKSD